MSVAIFGVTSCSETDVIGTEYGVSKGDIINVSGIDIDDDMHITSRATKQDADKVDWLVAPLKAGLDITYGNFTVNTQNQEEKQNEDVAILKLTDQTTTPATYEFKYRADRSATVGSTNEAIWYGNGSHYFEGVHVPERIRYNGASGSIDDVNTAAKAPGLTSDQHNANAPIDNEAGLGNYTLLAHYLGMPANTRITATVSRIKLPFRHRLARVVAFVLIDPILNTHLKGYNATVRDAEGNVTSQDDPNTTSFRFNNVQVLQGVKDVESGGHHTLTPQWVKARKVIPHFEGEKGSYSYKDNTSLADDFILYTKTDGNKETKDLYPTSSDWQKVHKAADHEGYTAVNYGKVPVYDIIVRPTYEDADHVMYDENLGGKTKTEFSKATNSIDFEIELENGLNYEKNFEFDLNANYQTVVYLRISREQVDYNDAGSELWIESKNNDGWYGVDNENGNTLSKAGSSWQRAYRTTTVSETAGTTSGVTDGDFYNNGENVGQYLGDADKWTKLLIQACEGGKHHGDYFILDQDITINAQDIPAGFVFTGHLDGQDHTITLTGTGQDTYDVTTNFSDITKLLYKKTASETSYTQFQMPEHLYISKEVAQAKPHSRSAEIPVGPDMMKEVTVTLAQVMANDVTYYVKENDKYIVWNPRTWTFYTHRISSSSIFCGLNGIYTTAQEKADNPYAPGFVWEANVHKESNKSTVWVPTLGYRAEVLNTVVKGGTLFSADATITGNVQNCFNLTSEGKQAVTNTPNIPKYK